MYVSVLGDSISTYEGYNPVGYNVFYKENKLTENELTDVAETWWMQVIEKIGGKLCVNNSFSGSYVYETCEFSISAKERCQSLHSNGCEPDVILIYAGANDCIGGIPVTDFYNSYTTMLKRINERYPKARVFSATLSIGAKEKSAMTDHVYSLLLPHNKAIRKAVSENYADIIDLVEYREYYPANDYTHPNKEGHQLLAEQWLRQLKNYISF